MYYYYKSLLFYSCSKMASTVMGCFQGIVEQNFYNKGTSLRKYKISTVGIAMLYLSTPQSYTPLIKQAALWHVQLQLKYN